jgi:S-formylglutathione hydrolase FrmB
LTYTKSYSTCAYSILLTNFIKPERREFRVAVLVLLSFLPIFVLGFDVTSVDSNGVKYYTVTSIYQGTQPLTVRVLEPTNPAAGKPRRFLYVLPVEQGVTDLSSTWGDGLEELRLLDVQNRFNMTLIAPSFNYEPWYGDNVTDPTMRMESFIVNDLVPFGDTFAHGTGISQRFLIGFSKSGNGALSLILRHPNVFSAAAAWDAPAQQSSLSAFHALSLNFGTQANYDLHNIPSLITTNAKPFQQQNRLWISGDQSAWTSDMDELHDQLVANSIPHTWVVGGFRVHRWNSGWLDSAVTALDAYSTPSAPADVNNQQTIAYGLRSSGLTFRPGTRFRLWCRALRRCLPRLDRGRLLLRNRPQS